jgi:hypothetical protein
MPPSNTHNFTRDLKYIMHRVRAIHTYKARKKAALVSNTAKLSKLTRLNNVDEFWKLHAQEYDTETTETKMMKKIREHTETSGRRTTRKPVVNVDPKFAATNPESQPKTPRKLRANTPRSAKAVSVKRTQENTPSSVKATKIVKPVPKKTPTLVKSTKVVQIVQKVTPKRRKPSHRILGITEGPLTTQRTLKSIGFANAGSKDEVQLEFEDHFFS